MKTIRLWIFLAGMLCVASNAQTSEEKLESKATPEQQKAIDFYNDFNNWKNQQTPETLELFKPFIQRYETAYEECNALLLTINRFHETYDLEQMQKFFNKIIHPNNSTTDFFIIIRKIQQTHHELMQTIERLSLEQKKIFEPFIKTYDEEYNKFIVHPNLLYSLQSIIQKQIAEDLKRNINIIKLATGYDTTLQSQAAATSDIETLEDLEGFLHSIRKMKPELLALQHIEDAQGINRPYIPLNSLDIPIGVSGEYKEKSQHISAGKEFLDSAPSSQHFILLHEYRHHLQNLAGVFLDESKAKIFYPEKVLTEAEKHTDTISWKPTSDRMVWKPYEHDADLFAASHINCPTCLKIVQAHQNIKVSPEGYFNQDDIEPFIQAAKHNPRCPAHSIKPGDKDHNQTIKELETALEQNKTTPNKGLRKKTVDLDKKSGDLLQHIPDYNEKLIKRIAQKKLIGTMMSDRAHNERYIHDQIEQTAREIQEGKHDIFKAPKTIFNTSDR